MTDNKLRELAGLLMDTSPTDGHLRLSDLPQFSEPPRRRRGLLSDLPKYAEPEPKNSLGLLAGFGLSEGPRSGNTLSGFGLSDGAQNRNALALFAEAAGATPTYAPSLPPSGRWTGPFGEVVEFDACKPAFSLWRRWPAIYVHAKLMRGLAGVWWWAVYVGETGDMADRMDGGHPYWPESQLYGADFVLVCYRTAFEAKSVRKAVEAQIIGHLNPPVNETHRTNL